MERCTQLHWGLWVLYLWSELMWVNKTVNWKHVLTMELIWNLKKVKKLIRHWFVAHTLNDNFTVQKYYHVSIDITVRNANTCCHQHHIKFNLRHPTWFFFFFFFSLCSQYIKLFNLLLYLQMVWQIFGKVEAFSLWPEEL